jgi:hypothetical protein
MHLRWRKRFFPRRTANRLHWFGAQGYTQALGLPERPSLWFNDFRSIERFGRDAAKRVVLDFETSRLKNSGLARIHDRRS